MLKRVCNAYSNFLIGFMIVPGVPVVFQVTVVPLVCPYRALCLCVLGIPCVSSVEETSGVAQRWLQYLPC